MVATAIEESTTHRGPELEAETVEEVKVTGPEKRRKGEERIKH